MIKKTALAVLAILVVFLVYVAFKSPDYAIARSIVIQAAPERIFPHMNSSRLAEKWGPWIEAEPQAKMIYSGPDSGVGAKTSWDTTGHLGTGSATIVESVPPQRVGIKLEYTKPMAMSQDSVYLIEPAGAGASKVTWSVTGKNSFMGRLMCSFVDMDKMMGSFFDKGLSNLKAIVESEPKS